MNIGEEIVAAYLLYVKQCEFTQQNLYTPDVQGEIDVVGINLKTKEIYVCEVAIHLTTGLQYVKDNKTNNVNKLTEKFSKDVKYAKKYFPDYVQHFMLWSPIVKSAGEKAKDNQMKDVTQIQKNIHDKYSVDIELIINDKFASCLREMKEFAKKETKELKSTVLRFMQIEAYLEKHLKNIIKK